MWSIWAWDRRIASTGLSLGKQARDVGKDLRFQQFRGGLASDSLFVKGVSVFTKQRHPHVQDDPGRTVLDLNAVSTNSVTTLMNCQLHDYFHPPSFASPSSNRILSRMASARLLRYRAAFTRSICDRTIAYSESMDDTKRVDSSFTLPWKLIVLSHGSCKVPANQNMHGFPTGHNVRWGRYLMGRTPLSTGS